MTQPYDQPPDSVPAPADQPQPDETVPTPPRGHQEPSGYPATPAHPQHGWYPRAPGVAGAGRPIHQPGAATAAAVFALLQATITFLATAIMVLAVSGSGDDDVILVGSVVAVVQLVGALLLIVGAVRLMLGRGRAALISGVTLELIISLGYLITAVRENSADQNPWGFDLGQGEVSEFEAVFEDVSEFLMGFVADSGVSAQSSTLPTVMVVAVLLAIMPVVSLVLSTVAPVGYYLRESYFARRASGETHRGR